MSLSLNTPLSLYSIPIVYATAFYPHTARYRLITKTVGFNNIKPREHDKEHLEKKGAPPYVIDRNAKLAGAHQNGNETFPLWVAAVLAANYAGVDDRTLNIVSGAFIGLRLLYNYIYVNAESPRTAGTRTLTFFAGISLPMYLLITAANKVRVGSLSNL